MTAIGRIEGNHRVSCHECICAVTVFPAAITIVAIGAIKMCEGYICRWPSCTAATMSPSQKAQFQDVVIGALTGWSVILAAYFYTVAETYCSVREGYGSHHYYSESDSDNEGEI